MRALFITLTVFGTLGILVPAGVSHASAPVPVASIFSARSCRDESESARKVYRQAQKDNLDTRSSAFKKAYQDFQTATDTAGDARKKDLKNARKKEARQAAEQRYQDITDAARQKLQSSLKAAREAYQAAEKSALETRNKALTSCTSA